EAAPPRPPATALHAAPDDLLWPPRPGAPAYRRSCTGEQGEQRGPVAAGLGNRTAPAPFRRQRFARRAPSDRWAKPLPAWGRSLRRLSRLRYRPAEALRGPRPLQSNRGEGRPQLARRLFFAQQGAFPVGNSEE